MTRTNLERYTQAIDYINQKIGYTGQVMYEVTIPICEECVQRLQATEYVLLYCLKCADNKWVYKPYAKLDYYNKHICWMSCCPECKEPDEEVKVFFTE